MINNMKLSKITKNILKNSNIIPLLYSNLFYNSFNTLEHIYPKSYIKNISHNYDIHNIYTSNYNMNALRSNYKYSELNNNYVTCLLESSDGSIWVGTWGGLAKIKDNNWEVFNTSNTNDTYSATS